MAIDFRPPTPPSLERWKALPVRLLCVSQSECSHSCICLQALLPAVLGGEEVSADTLDTQVRTQGSVTAGMV